MRTAGRGVFLLLVAAGAFAACRSGGGATDGAGCGSPEGGDDPACSGAAGAAGGSGTEGTSVAGASGGMGGAPGATGGIGDSSAGQGAAIAGAPDQFGGASGNAGAGGDVSFPDPETAPSLWLAFAQQQGTFAYDVAGYPDPEGVVQLSNTNGGVFWSPNGETLVYRDGLNVRAADLDETPVSTRLLATPTRAPASQVPNPAVAWSGDSSSLAVVSWTTLSVLDPSQVTPVLHVVTTSLASYQWAPKGNRLLYVDKTGTHVVAVTKGEPGTRFDVNSSARLWSPKGTQLVGMHDGNIELTTLQDDAATLQLLTDVPPDSSYPDGVVPSGAPSIFGVLEFNPDGSKLAFDAKLDGGSTLQPYLADLEVAPVAITPVVTGAGSGRVVCVALNALSRSTFSPDGKRLLCERQNPVGVFAGDASGGPPTLVVSSVDANSWSWSPGVNENRLLHLYEPPDDCSKPTPTTRCSSTLQLVDLTDPSKSAVFAFENYGVTTALVSPDGQRIVLGDTADRLHLYSVSDSAQGKFIHSGTSGNCSGGHCSWSPDSQFFASEDGNHRLALASVTGSLAIFLQEVSKVSVSFAWRP